MLVAVGRGYARIRAWQTVRPEKSWFAKREAKSLASPRLSDPSQGFGPIGHRPNRASAHHHSEGTMIIDCHGHYTTEPKDLGRFRQEQIAAIKDPSKKPSRASLKISDDDIREGLEGAQLKFQRERDTDLVIFSPRAMGMGHHIGDFSVSF